MTPKEEGLKVRQAFFDAGEILFNEGDPPTGLFIIEEGEVEVYRQSGGRHTIIARLGRGEVVGELAMIEAQPHTRSVRAMTALDVLVIEPEQLDDAMAASSPLVRMVLRRVVRKLHRTNDIAFGASRRGPS